MRLPPPSCCVLGAIVVHARGREPLIIIILAIAVAVAVVGHSLIGKECSHLASSHVSGAEKELLVLVNIYKAEGELHHVDVRRRDGPQWQFYLFYSEFRRAMSEKLGMGDYSQLSMYSPLIGRDRRQVPAARLGGVGAPPRHPRAVGSRLQLRARRVGGRAHRPRGRVVRHFLYLWIIIEW